MHCPGTRRSTDIEAVRQATRRVLRAVDDLTDEQAAGRSLLPGWSRAEVLTHLARNADGGRGIARGRGARARSASSTPAAPSSARPGSRPVAACGAAALLADLRRSCDALMESWMQLPDDAWERVGALAHAASARSAAGCGRGGARSRCTTSISGSGYSAVGVAGRAS